MLRQASADAPLGEREVPLCRGPVPAGQVGRFHPPPGRGEHDAAVAQAREERRRRGNSPVEGGHLGALAARELGEQPGQRRGVLGEVERVHAHGLDATAETRGGQVHPAAVAGHREVGRSEHVWGGRPVLLQADQQRQDAGGSGDVRGVGQ